jgi:hypothetical protein
MERPTDETLAAPRGLKRIRVEDIVLFASAALAFALHWFVWRSLTAPIQALYPNPMTGGGDDSAWLAALREAGMKMVACELAFLATLAVAAVVLRRRPPWGRALAFGIAAAFVTFVGRHFGIGLRVVMWNVPFWLAVAGIAAHFAKRPELRRVLLELSLTSLVAIETATVT